MERKTDEPQKIAQMGICEKSLDGIVISQNELCRKICGERRGQICKDGCMVRYQADGLESGFKTIKHLRPEAPMVEAVLVNDGTTLTTLLFDASENIRKCMTQMESIGLSRTESEIVKSALQGFTNQEIADKFFISKKTLRTHLNNVYRKMSDTLKLEFLDLTSRRR